ncbi:hypothetical protein [Crossiella sp. CA198]|uniref:hypothetical protein n=1 Tax=Crossiella sp. CA198 TaxID=3455607 RepID=UPI003F8D5FB6
MPAIAAFARGLSAPEYRAIQAELDIGDDYQRELGLFLAVVRRDLETLVSALSDPRLRPRALAASTRLPIPAEALTEVLRTAPRRDRLLLYRMLRQSRRRGLADEFLPEVAARFDLTEARTLLTACSPSVIGMWLPRLGAPPGLLRSLARLVPEVVLDRLAAELPGLDESNQWRWRRRNRGLLPLLVRRIPGAVARLLISPGWGLPLEAEDRTPRLATAIVHAAGAELPEVFRKLGDSGMGPLLLRELPLDRRRELLEQVYPGQVAEQAGAELLAELPAADRVQLVRTALELGGSGRLPFQALLPAPEAEAALAEATGSHRVRTREYGWRVRLDRAVRLGDPALFAAVVQDATRALHDQDRVRAYVLGALREAPARLLSAVPVAVLAEAVSTAVQAKDSSQWTFEPLAEWLRRTIAATRDPARQIALVPLFARSQRDRRAPARRLAVRLAPEVWARLWAELRESVLREAAAGRYGPALRAAEMFGADLDSVPELDQLLWTVARHTRDPRQAETAIRLWLNRSGPRGERVGQVVRGRPEWGGQPVVWREVSTRRTDLLDLVLPVLDPLPRVPRSVLHRWTAAQRARYAERARAIALDERTELWQRVAAIAGVREVPTLMSFTTNESHPIVAAAVEALGATAPTAVALPVLLQVAGGPSGPGARAAVRALHRALDTLPDAESVAALGNLLDEAPSVGTAKEAARILGRLAGGESARVLLRLWAKPALHQDVRAAVAGALAGLLDEPGVHEALTEALAGTAAVRGAVLATEVDRVLPSRQPVFASLVARAVSTVGKDNLTETDLAFWTWWRHLPDRGATLAALLRQDLPERMCRRVADCLLGSVPVAEALPALRSLLADLVPVARSGDDSAWRRVEWLYGGRALRHGDPAGQAGLDRVLVDGFRAAGMHREAAGLLDLMARASLVDGVRTELWDELVEVVDDRAFRLPREFGHGGAYNRAVAAETVLAVVDHLGGLPGVVPGLLAARLLGRGGKLARWSEPWVLRRTRLLGHADPDVRAAARSLRGVR